jgi:hypothetical protein
MQKRSKTKPDADAVEAIFNDLARSVDAYA